ncbi:MAG: dihydrodipicolinate synthase family protein [Niabella sp.]
MNNEKKFIPVMLTPFHEDGSIDFKGLADLTRFYLDKGAKGLFANCQSSEMFDLTPDERLTIIECVLKAADGKVPVVAAGNFGDTISQQADFVKKVYDTGVDAVIVLTGLLVAEDENDEVLEQHIDELLSLTTNIPLGFYECPQPYKRILSPHLLGKLVHTGRIIYHKDTCLDIAQVREKNELCRDVPAFGLYDAYMVHAVASLHSGSAGLSCIQGNYFPELIAWLCDNYDNKNQQKEVALVQQFFMDEMNVMHEDYPKSAKYYLWKKGVVKSMFTRKDGDSTLSPITKNNIDQLGGRYEALLRKVQVVKVGIPDVY